MQYNFEWDPAKARRNVAKHGIDFNLAAEIFKDAMSLTIYDENHANSNEDRWITLGQVSGHHYLVVVHTYRNHDDNSITVRLISARSATKFEIKQYKEG